MLSRNLGAKALALALAVVVWVYVLFRTSPTAETVMLVSVRAQELSPEYSYTLVPERIAARLRGPRDRLAALEREPGGLLAFANAKGLGPGEHDRPVSVSGLPEAVRVVSLEPATVRINVERLVDRTFRLVLKSRELPPLGFTVTKFTISPPEVVVRGKDSEITRIASAGVDPDLKTLADRGLAAAQVRFYDTQGKEITPALTVVDPPLVTVSVEAASLSVKVVPVHVVVEYPQDSGWLVQSVEVRPATLVLVGPPKTLNGVGVLRVPLVVEQPEPVVNDTITIEPPPGLEFRGGDQVSVRVRMIPPAGPTAPTR